MKDRVLMAYPPSELPFLPPFEEFLRLSGFAAGMPGLIREIGAQLNKVPPSEKTLKKAFTNPVTRSTANRIQDIVAARLPNYVDLETVTEKFKPWEELQLRSNGASWFPAIISIRDFCLKDRFPNARAERFIHDRISAEYDFLVEVKRIALNPSGDKLDNELKEGAMRKLLYEHTLVDKDLIEKASRVRISDPQRPMIEQRFWQDIRIDFYYNLLSELSLDILQRFKEVGLCSKGADEMVSKGLMGLLAPKRGSDSRVHYPFAQLLERWRIVYSKEADKQLSLRELSKAIPHPSDERLDKLSPGSLEYRDLKEVAMATRKKRLREWQDGVCPQDEQLESFIKNLIPEGENGYYAWLIAHISIIWGRFIDQEVQRHDANGALYPLDEGLLFRYHDIWKHYRDQAADILAT